MPYLPESFKVEKETAHYFHQTAQTNAHRHFTSTVFSTTTENVSKTNGWNWMTFVYGCIAAGAVVATIVCCFFCCFKCKCFCKLFCK